MIKLGGSVRERAAAGGFAESRSRRRLASLSLHRNLRFVRHFPTGSVVVRHDDLLSLDQDSDARSASRRTERKGPEVLYSRTVVVTTQPPLFAPTCGEQRGGGRAARSSRRAGVAHTAPLPPLAPLWFLIAGWPSCSPARSQASRSPAGRPMELRSCRRSARRAAVPIGPSRRVTAVAIVAIHLTYGLAFLRGVLRRAVNEIVSVSDPELARHSKSRGPGAPRCSRTRSRTPASCPSTRSLWFTSRPPGLPAGDGRRCPRRFRRGSEDHAPVRARLCPTQRGTSSSRRSTRFPTSRRSGRVRRQCSSFRSSPARCGGTRRRLRWRGSDTEPSPRTSGSTATSGDHDLTLDQRRPPRARYARRDPRPADGGLDAGARRAEAEDAVRTACGGRKARTVEAVRSC